MTTFTAMNTADQTKAIKSIRSRGKKLKADTVALANGFLLHYVQHGDMSNAMAIYAAICETYTKGAGKAFIDWCQTYTNTLRWNEEAGELMHIKGEKRETIQDRDGKTHEEVSFFELVVENTKPVDFLAGLCSLIKRAETGIANDNAKGYTQEQVNALAQFATEQGWIEKDEAEGLTQRVVDPATHPAH